MHQKMDWALRYLHWCIHLDNVEKGEMNDHALAEDELIDEFKLINEVV